MGIEDAMVLPRCARQASDWNEALAIYQATRLERGNHVQAASSKQGLYLLNLQPGVSIDRSLMGEDALGLYGYDAVHVNLQKVGSKIALDIEYHDSTSWLLIAASLKLSLIPAITIAPESQPGTDSLLQTSAGRRGFYVQASELCRHRLVKR